MSGLGPYKIDNLQVDGYDVVVNKQKTAAYRAPGQPQAAFAVEPVIDELAEKLGMDPLEFRIKNSVHEGDRAPSGVPHLRFGCEEVEQAMKAHAHYNAPLEGPNRGRGVAVGYRLNGGGSGSSATINVNANGTINLLTGLSRHRRDPHCGGNAGRRGAGHLGRRRESNQLWTRTPLDGRAGPAAAGSPSTPAAQLSTRPRRSSGR